METAADHHRRALTGNDDNDKMVSPPPRSIFRPFAVERYRQAKATSVYPRLVSPRTILYGWLLLGILVAATLLSSAVQVPTFAHGRAAVVRRAETPRLARQDVAFLVALPRPFLRRLQVGERLIVQSDAAGARWRGTIVAVEPPVGSPDTLARRLGIERSLMTSTFVAQPATLIVVRFAPSPGLHLFSGLGNPYGVDVEIGSQRLVFLVRMLHRPTDI